MPKPSKPPKPVVRAAPQPQPPSPAEQQAMQTMDSVAASLASATLVDGPATASERAALNEYIVDSDDNEDAGAEIDAFERRLAARQSPAEQSQPRSQPAPAQRAGAKPVPHHLLGLIDGSG